MDQEWTDAPALTGQPTPPGSPMRNTKGPTLVCRPSHTDLRFSIEPPWDSAGCPSPDPPPVGCVQHLREHAVPSREHAIMPSLPGNMNCTPSHSGNVRPCRPSRGTCTARRPAQGTCHHAVPLGEHELHAVPLRECAIIPSLPGIMHCTPSRSGNVRDHDHLRIDPSRLYPLPLPGPSLRE
jgi:hypothetical protein